MNRVQPDITLPIEPRIKKYSALLQQSGTAIPSAGTLYNTLIEGTLTWTRLGIGSYRATTTGEPFKTLKTSIIFPNITDGIGSAAIVDENTIAIGTYNVIGEPTDSLLNYNYLEIQVYTTLINNVIS